MPTRGVPETVGSETTTGGPSTTAEGFEVAVLAPAELDAATLPRSV